jgi:hypothetical protein
MDRQSSRWLRPPQKRGTKGSDMGFRGGMVRVLVVIAMMAVYITVLWLGLTEENRRSLAIVKSSNSSVDYVIINVRVTSIEPAQGLLHERIKLIPMGRFAIDKVTPATDLKLLINSVSGKQTVFFPKGERIFPVDFNSLLSGNQNRYPFDRYTSEIDLLVTAPAQKAEPMPEQSSDEEDPDPLASALVVGSSDLVQNETVPIKENFSASIPGVKFNGDVTRDEAYKLMHTTIAIRRANSVISVSIVVMAVMFLLAVSIMVMVLRVTASPDAINLIPLSLCVALIFGLPALRNAQPGVPGVGALSDYISFIWAEFIVSTSAIVLAWTWIIRSMQERKTKALPSERQTASRSTKYPKNRRPSK